MIDICMVIYNNYDIAEMLLSHMEKWLTGDYRMFIADNSTVPDKSRMAALTRFNSHLEWGKVTDLPNDGDGVSHGLALDLIKKRTSADIVATLDSDFFWTKPDIFEFVESKFAEGVEVIGAALWYPDWNNMEHMWPERRGSFAPALWGQFLKRDIAMEESFGMTPHEITLRYEAGWRIRKKIIEESRPGIVFPGFKLDNQVDTETCYFGSPNAPVGMHVMKASWRNLNYPIIERDLELAKLPWISS